MVTSRWHDVLILKVDFGGELVELLGLFIRYETVVSSCDVQYWKVEISYKSAIVPVVTHEPSEVFAEEVPMVDDITYCGESVLSDEPLPKVFTFVSHVDRQSCSEALTVHEDHLGVKLSSNL